MDKQTRIAPADTDSSFLKEWHQEIISRRAFLARMAGVSVAALFPLTATATAQAPGTGQGFTVAQQSVLSATQNHLFPSEPGIPGANEINAMAYLGNVLADPYMESYEKAFIRNGAGWLEELTQEKFGTSFTELDSKQREQMLRKIEQSGAGENWLATLLIYILEALLSDPVYGGNPNAIGWRWLEHQPGFPQPPADKIYGKL